MAVYARASRSKGDTPMSIPDDAISQGTRAVRAVAPQLPNVCPVCLGAGHYLEAFAGDPTGELLPIRCTGCEGAGRRTTL